MSQKKNKMQDSIMMEFMIANPDIARGDSKDGRDVILEKWTKLQRQLNLLGPPIKNLPIWKKTWKNRLRSIRTSLARNPSGNGLSTSEQEVATICGLYDSKQAVTSSRSLKKVSKSFVKKEPLDEAEFLTDDEKENKRESMENGFAGFSSPLPSQQASVPSTSESMSKMLRTLQAMNAQQAEHFRNMEAIEQKKLEVTKTLSENIIKFLKK